MRKWVTLFAGSFALWLGYYIIIGEPKAIKETSKPSINKPKPIIVKETKKETKTEQPKKEEIIIKDRDDAFIYWLLLSLNASNNKGNNS